jgi:hypothetical protein
LFPGDLGRLFACFISSLNALAIFQRARRKGEAPSNRAVQLSEAEGAPLEVSAGTLRF